MKDETMGQEDAAQDAEACAEALESLDQIALAEIAFDDSSVDVQDEPEIEAQPDDRDAKADGAAPIEKIRYIELNYFCSFILPCIFHFDAN